MNLVSTLLQMTSIFYTFNVTYNKIILHIIALFNFAFLNFFKQNKHAHPVYSQFLTNKQKMGEKKLLLSENQSNQAE